MQYTYKWRLAGGISPRRICLSAEQALFAGLKYIGNLLQPVHLRYPFIIACWCTHRVEMQDYLIDPCYRKLHGV